MVRTKIQKRDSIRKISNFRNTKKDKKTNQKYQKDFRK